MKLLINQTFGGFPIPILLFGNRHVELITGKKTATIRKLWKKPLSPGDRLHCYWNLVSKERKKLFEARVTDLEIIKFGDLIKNDSLAQEEGYSNAKELESDFRKIYPDDTADSSLFQVIRFKKLPIEEWEGKKIDEKSMITKRADILFDVGKFNKSVVCYNAALKFDPNDIYLLNKKGDNLSRLGRFEEAIECYDKAIKLDNQNEYIYNNKAIALLNSNQPQKALQCSDKAMKINNKNEFVLYWRGFIMEMLGKLDLALECYDKILEMNPEDPDVWNAKGNILSELERTEEALHCYERALELCLEEPPDSAMWNRKGNALMELGRFEEALHCYD
ncbi:MAG TPA: tetratricopeptide repeat protein, partial [Methanobacterium sp.]